MKKDQNRKEELNCLYPPGRKSAGKEFLKAPRRHEVKQSLRKYKNNIKKTVFLTVMNNLKLKHSKTISNSINKTYISIYLTKM